MRMQVRIKASDAFEDRFALSLVGGKYAERPYPIFIFKDQAQRNQYDQVRRRIKEENEGGSTKQSAPEVRTAARRYRRSGEFRI